MKGCLHFALITINLPISSFLHPLTVTARRAPTIKLSDVRVMGRILSKQLKTKLNNLKSEYIHNLPVYGTDEFSLIKAISLYFALGL